MNTNLMPARYLVPRDKPRFTRLAAWAVAVEICNILTPVCSRFIVAGSMRRGKETVGDVEILYIPRYADRRVDMFSVESVNLADEACTRMLDDGTLRKRASKTGSFAWGQKNKFAVHRSGIPVDLFAATELNWWNYLVCRTGPAESNARICVEAQKRGWKWSPYSPGFSRFDPQTGKTIEHAVGSEEEVFWFVDLPFFPPAQRR